MMLSMTIRRYRAGAEAATEVMKAAPLQIVVTERPPSLQNLLWEGAAFWLL
jgi:hypothetical protein